MKVSGTSGADMQCGGASMAPGMGDQMDEVSRNLQKQIENLQKQVKELSANQEMPSEIKMKKRQELQKQISDLQVQLRQHQMEVKREEARKKEEKASEDNIFDSCSISEEGRKQSAGLSAGSMEAMLSADAAMKQADVHGSTANKMERRAKILESEISRDKGGPGDATAAKEEILADTKEAAEKAAASQMESLGKANEIMKDASETERKNDRDQTEDGEKKPGEAVGRQGEDAEAVSGPIASGTEAQGINGVLEQQGSGQEEQDQRKAAYHPVDVRI